MGDHLRLKEKSRMGAVGAGCSRSQAEKCESLASFTAGVTAAFHGFLACDAATSLKGRASGELHLCLGNTRLGLGL